MSRVPGVLHFEDAVGAAVPVVFDSPHSGAEYPRDFRYIVPKDKIRHAEDMYVNELFKSAPNHGASLIAALFPRSYIDPNRALDDLDPELLSDGWPEPLRPGEKAKLGHGLIWRLCPPDMALYAGKLTRGDVLRRIDQYWKPYHARLRESLDSLHGRFNAVWHVNCHSMPSATRPPFINGGGQADFVLGDRDGTTASPDFVHLVRDTLRQMGYSVKVNDPYKGVELIRAYSDPRVGRHSLQIEINRGLYMDEKTFRQLPEFADLQRNIDRLIKAICEYARDGGVR
ncbi:MAG: N-formylglutamate amidohydrolase [Alphaproteobacteria bacterium]|nr:N-formylglutamate amidohydrolase [Alphaproteobacteria bacterium]